MSIHKHNKKNPDQASFIDQASIIGQHLVFMDEDKCPYVKLWIHVVLNKLLRRRFEKTTLCFLYYVHENYSIVWFF